MNKNKIESASEESLADLVEFFSRPGISQKGIAEEANIDPSHLSLVLNRRRKLTGKVKKKLEPWLIYYGFKEKKPNSTT